MLNSDSPPKIAIPFANSGSRNVIPVPSQIGLVDGAASYSDGFPPLTFTDPLAGGIPPSGQDFNGILYAVTNSLRWHQAGGQPVFDSAFAAAVGGYPKWSLLQSADGQGMWLSTADNNSSNPDTGGANWIPLVFAGSASAAVAGTSYTLSASQYARSLIGVAGTLTNNVALTFPVGLSKQWLVINFSTGAFSVSVKTPTGTPVTLNHGANFIYSDGSNILQCNVITSDIFASTLDAWGSARQSLGTNGYGWLPGGRLEQWGSYTSDVAQGTSVTVTFPAPFPSACFNVQITSRNPSADSGADSWPELVSRSASSFTVYAQGVATGSLTLHGFDWRAVGD